MGYPLKKTGTERVLSPYTSLKDRRKKKELYERFFEIEKPESEDRA